jgi:mannose-6-phosphate isomerase
MRLDKLIEEKGEGLLGKELVGRKFPLLIKFLSPNEKLSVQVHPNDKYAAKYENGELGKTEAWYIVEANEDAYIVLGTNGCSKEEFQKSIEDGTVENYMNKINVKKGDVYYLKSGLIHTMGPGVIVAEIQQNSDTTYRVYDYGRGRETHVKKALDVIRFDSEGRKREGLLVEKDGYSKTYYCLSEHFSLEIYNIFLSMVEESDNDRFYIFTAVEGEGRIYYNKGKVDFKRGESIFIPATLGEYSIQGNCKLIKSYVPDVETVQEKILNIIK